MPCHLSTYWTKDEECTSLDGTIIKESAHLGSFPIIVSKSVFLVKFASVNTLSIVSPLTAALHVVDFILHFIPLHSGNLGAFGLSFLFTINIGKWKAGHHREAGEASRSRIQNKHIKNFISESYSYFLDPQGWGPLAHPVPSRGRCAAVLRPPLGWGGHGLRVVRGRGLPCRPPEVAVVVPFYRPPGVTVLEDMYLCCGRGCVDCVPANELDRADYGVGFSGRSHEEDVVDVVGGRSRARCVMCRLC